MAQNTNRLTDKQKEILEFIRDRILTKGYPPAVREICEAVHLKSTSSVHSHLETLEKNGFIRRDPSKSRTIEIVDDEYGIFHEEMARVPIIGKVAAGQPLLAQENIEGFFPLPAEQLPQNEVFFLKVQGESMVNAGILDGDHILVEKTPVARNGEIVVALVEDSATVKRFYKENGHFRLQPENDHMEPILVPDCQIVGKVIGLMRFGIQ